MKHDHLEKDAEKILERNLITKLEKDLEKNPNKLTLIKIVHYSNK